jgi:predicted transcriptional regulator
MTEASRVQKLLTEQNAEIDRLKNSIENLTKSNTNLRILAMTNSERVVSLENSFRTILDHAEQWVIQEIARKALEGKDNE